VRERERRKGTSAFCNLGQEKLGRAREKEKGRKEQAARGARPGKEGAGPLGGERKGSWAGPHGGKRRGRKAWLGRAARRKKRKRKRERVGRAQLEKEG
jgi:hypothetical protein